MFTELYETVSQSLLHGVTGQFVMTARVMLSCGSPSTLAAL